MRKGRVLPAYRLRANNSDSLPYAMRHNSMHLEFKYSEGGKLFCLFFGIFRYVKRVRRRRQIEININTDGIELMRLMQIELAFMHSDSFG